MDTVVEMLQWVRSNPRIAIGALVVVAIIWGLAQRKPRVFREADRDFERLRNERGASYDKTRPLS